MAGLDIILFSLGANNGFSCFEWFGGGGLAYLPRTSANTFRWRRSLLITAELFCLEAFEYVDLFDDVEGRLKLLYWLSRDYVRNREATDNSFDTLCCQAMC